MAAKKIRHLAVIDKSGAAIGVVTFSNILAHLDYDYFVDVKKIHNVMTRHVITVKKGMPVQQVMLMMAEENVSCLVIVEDNSPIGIITERDTAKLLLGFADIVLLPVEQVMSKSLYTVGVDVPLHVAVTMMRHNKLRRLVVVDQNDQLVGLATQSDIIRGLEGKYVSTLNQIISEKDHTIKATTRDLSVKTTYLDNILKSSIDTGIIAVDLKMLVTYFNPAAERILGYSAREILGTSIKSFHDRFKIPSEKFDTVMKLVVSGGTHTFVMKTEAQGEQAFIRARISGIMDEEEQLIGFFLMINDITRRKIAERELQRTHDGLEERVKERTKDLARAMEGTVQAMALAVEMRDPYTSGHQRRVADLAVMIARKMELDEKIIEGIYMAGLIHDIGKIRVPSGILCSPGILSDAEFAILKPHPEIGYNILKEIDFPWPLATIVLQHHERIDGSGYPAALKGDGILIEARVLAVADVVEAMFSHRPYRPSLGLDRALEEVVKHKGKHYDSDVVDACMQVLQDDKYQLPPSFDISEQQESRY
jgi:PAS domain S-box-containing protein